MNSSNETSPLHPQVLVEGVVPLQHIPNMVGRLNPGKSIVIQLDFGQSNVLLGEVNALRFRLCWINMCAEIEVVGLGKLLADIHHSLETHSAWTK